MTMITLAVLLMWKCSKFKLNKIQFQEKTITSNLVVVFFIFCRLTVGSFQNSKGGFIF